ncbi:MAG TPA: A24 family peptidase, partial [Nocardioides sp.]|uniref:A24 family peptidase n=1 Tax=Nocardioides sp. TaxID=35761 RepID=UPI002BE4EFB2
AEPEPPKELYVEIARRPGLGRRTALVALAAGGLLGAELGWAWPLVYLLPLVPLLVALSVIDLRTRLLPTRLITPCYAVAVLGVGVTWLATRDTPDLIRAGAGWLVAGLVFFVLWFAYPRGMGYGDVRLSGVLGLVLGSLGWGQLFVGLYAGFLLFGLPGLLLAVLRRDRALLRSAYPFGPFMILGALLGVLWGQPLWAGLAGG